MKRANNDRVVDPDRDDRLRAVAECVARSGYPAEYSGILAEGFVARLRRRVYAALNDVIGTGDDLESLAGWQGPPRALSAVMNRVGYVRDINGVYVMVDAINEAPEYLKKRWQRRDRATYDAAVKRSGAPNIVNQAYGVPGDDDDYQYDAEMQRDSDMQDSQQNLFGSEPEQAKGEKHVGVPGFKEASIYWAERHQQEQGYAYAWRGRCNKHLAEILTELGSLDKFRRVADAFLADKSFFYAGHELRVLWRDLAKFRALAEQSRRGAGRSAANTSTIRTDAGRREL